MEQFKPFPLNNAVLVGNLGTIIKPNGKPAKLSKHSLGYLSVGITINGVCKVMKAHRVIALTWVDNPHNKPTVNHEDGIKTNIVADNLTWMTMKEQHEHAWRTGLQTAGAHSTGMTGHKHSEQAKQRMSEAKKGRKREGYRGKWILSVWFTVQHQLTGR